MTVKELIEQLSEFDEDLKVTLYSHGTCGLEEQEEVIDCYEDTLFDDNGNIILKVISLTTY